MPAAPDSFLVTLAGFSSGAIPVDEFAATIRALIVDGPVLIRHEGAEPDMVFTPQVEAAFAFDMVIDEGSNHDVDEARRLAHSYSLLLAHCEVSDPALPGLMDLARWKSDTVTRIRQFLAGRFDRAGFERFLVRRPWPDEIINAVAALDNFGLTMLANDLDADDWKSIRSRLAAA